MDASLRDTQPSSVHLRSLCALTCLVDICLCVIMSAYNCILRFVKQMNIVNIIFANSNLNDSVF